MATVGITHDSTDDLSYRKDSLHIYRRFFHALAGLFFPVLALVINEKLFFVVLFGTSALIVGMDGIRISVSSVNQFATRKLEKLMRIEERKTLLGATYGLLGMSITFWLFRNDIEIAVMAVVFLAFGDPAAALIGIKFRRWAVLGKTISGSSAMFTVIIMSIILLSLTGVITFRWSFVFGALVSTIIELLPIPINDNLTIPLSAGITIWAVGVL
jgi:glycerol-3-phosphate acyltransferase PlsY